MDARKIVIVPTYNERNNVSVLIPRLISLPLGLDILVVDDNSPDGTAEEVQALQKKQRSVHLLVGIRTTNLPRHEVSFMIPSLA